MNEAPVIAIENVSFSYDGAPVLEGANLTIGQGDFVSIIGPNGGGKTTLLKIILGLLKPKSGTVRVFGMTPEQARPLVGYMPQHVNLDPQFPVSVMDVVLMGRLGNGPRLGPYRRKDRLAAQAAIKEVRLLDLRKRPFSTLSGGQQQRVLIARALASEPRLLLLDEPTAGLDLHVEGEFLELLRELNKRLTVALVSHDVGFVSQYAKNVVCVKRNVRMHPTSEITGEIIQEIYGGDVRMVRHDRHSTEGGFGCLNS